jgi:hypothetical protein
MLENAKVNRIVKITGRKANWLRRIVVLWMEEPWTGGEWGAWCWAVPR